MVASVTVYAILGGGACKAKGLCSMEGTLG